MANTLFDTGRAAFANAGVAFLTDTIKVALVRGYTVSQAHAFLSDVTTAGGTLVATATLAGKSNSAGVLNASNVTFAAVPAGSACNLLIIYKDTGTPSSSQLIAAIDTATGLPVTPNGGDITVAWDAGANKILKL